MSDTPSALRFIPAAQGDLIELSRRCCGACWKTRREVDALFKCGGCSQQWYCSKACQKKNWPIHRTYCAVNAGLVRSTTQRGQSVWSDLSRWVQRYERHLATAMVHSYDLPNHPYANVTNTLFIRLRHDSSAPKAASRLKIEHLEVVNTEDLLAVYGDAEFNELTKREETRILQCAQDQLRAEFGGVGHICFLVGMGDQQVVRMNTLAFNKALATEERDPLWMRRLVMVAGNLS